MAPPRKRKCARSIQRRERDRIAACRANESRELCQQRQLADSKRTAAARACEAEDERYRRQAANAQRTATARASESNDQVYRHQAANTQRMAIAIASKTVEERCRRQAADAPRIPNVRYEVWRQKENSASQCNSNICYEYDPLIAIGRMTLESNFCQALRWKGESPGMCFSNGKIRLHLLCKELFHQFVVDMYAKIESARLRLIRLNQKKLRVEDYIHLRDAINSDGDINEFRKPTILPSSFKGCLGICMSELRMP
ncbi:hypothetical protein AVEN_2211-1 [Araneus ventricosus]|uniref:Helitron helicase-like domain-containing protein n=1 Tax=Araneus ventricosus TaxID=182803 RepID=A0A4Y2VD97_ARAVE|nr:hypothetical protein AVEN_2211-1 [Araneus ventricosus]